MERLYVEEGTRMKTILFVCTVNRYRSPIAHFFLKNMLAEMDMALFKEIEVSSAGIILKKKLEEMRKEGIEVPEPLWGYRPYPCLIFHMARRGIDISQHKSRLLDSKMANKANLLIAMTNNHKDAILAAFPYLKEKVITLPGFDDSEIFEVAKEPPGLMPSSDFCMHDCDTWWLTEKGISHIEELVKKVIDDILLRIKNV